MAKETGFKVYEAVGNWSSVTKILATFEEAQNFVLSKITDLYPLLIEDGYDEDEAISLAASYYWIEEA